MKAVGSRVVRDRWDSGLRHKLLFGRGGNRQTIQHNKCASQSGVLLRIGSVSATDGVQWTVSSGRCPADGVQRKGDRDARELQGRLGIPCPMLLLVSLP